MRGPQRQSPPSLSLVKGTEMKHRLLVSSLVVSAAVALGSAAWAGYKTTYSVFVGSGIAWGAMGDARASADSTTYIGCSRSGYPGSYMIQCYAKNASGTYGTCAINDPAMASTVASITPSSYIFFEWNASNTCTYLSVDNASYLTPIQP
jgi:hypothetical protein